jgi:hypothetical protein
MWILDFGLSVLTMQRLNRWQYITQGAAIVASDVEEDG